MTTYTITYYSKNDITGVTGQGSDKPRQFTRTMDDLPTLLENRPYLIALVMMKPITDGDITLQQALDNGITALVTCGTNSLHLHGFRKEIDFTNINAVSNLYSVL